MTPFHDTLHRIVTSAETRSNTITDGQATYKYGELPALLEEVERYLRERGIGSTACLAVECGNSLPGALLLIALLRNGNSFILMPPAANGELKPTPHFCSDRVTVLPAQPGDGALPSPVRSLQAEPNPHHNGRLPEPGRLYLRTSGSMGASKIVVHTHERLIGNAGNCVLKYGFSPASRAVIPVPIAHMYGFGAEFLPAILTGASIDLQEKTNLLKYLDREKRFQPTIAFITPAICDMLLKAYKAPRAHYAAMVTSGQRIADDRFRALDAYVGGRLVNQYGSTEMGATAACDPDDGLDRKATTIGEPMPGVQLRVDASNSELCCSHPYGFEGYVDEAGEWLRRAASDGWYRTGDLAAVQPDGFIAVLGRADASVNRSGYLVLLSDIERVMEKLDAVGELAVVAGKNEGKQGLRIAAFCVPRSGMLLDGAQIRRRCFELLPHYAIPDEVRIIDKLPALPSGKVDRQTLAALVG